MRIGLTGIFVTDQEKARDFYTQVLGLQVKVDAPYSDTERWISLVSPEDPDGTAVTLHQVDDDTRAFQRAAREAGRPTMSFTTDDCQRDYERLVAKGVVFTLPPTTMSYGGTDAVFEDGFGNLLNLHQD
jgi:catechol 2,3-dioxygenase-like lactoylglutathione lyase family enzyme